MSDIKCIVFEMYAYRKYRKYKNRQDVQQMLGRWRISLLWPLKILNKQYDFMKISWIFLPEENLIISCDANQVFVYVVKVTANAFFLLCCRVLHLVKNRRFWKVKCVLSLISSYVIIYVPLFNTLTPNIIIMRSTFPIWAKEYAPKVWW